MSGEKFDPFTGARLNSMTPQEGQPRLGVPADKMALAGIPLLTEDGRQAVMMMVFPPEGLRDQPLEVIEQVIALQGQGLLKAIALEIYKAFTSDPTDAAAARNVAENIAAHAAALAKRGPR